MHKDKDKQREAGRERQRRYRASKGVTSQNVTKGVTNEAAGSPSRDERRMFNSTVLLETIPRRGKDITKFEHLPSDVQATIDRLSSDEHEHARRTVIAINYQHLFPDKYECHGVGVAPADIPDSPVPVKVSLPGDDDYKPLCAFTRDWQLNKA